LDASIKTPPVATSLPTRCREQFFEPHHQEIATTTMPLLFDWIIDFELQPFISYNLKGVRASFPGTIVLGDCWYNSFRSALQFLKSNIGGATMPLKIICVKGPGSTGKSTIIREFTNRYLRHSRAKGDVLGIFQMPRRRYAVGVSGSGDTSRHILKGHKYLSPYGQLKVMIIASRTGGKTLDTVEKLAMKEGAELQFVSTKKLNSAQHRSAALTSKVRAIKRLMPA